MTFTERGLTCNQHLIKSLWVRDPLLFLKGEAGANSILTQMFNCFKCFLFTEFLLKLILELEAD